MTNDYASLIHNNPIVPYAMHGFQRSHWCNMITVMSASVKQFHIFVYANNAAEATSYANRLKQYIEAHPVQGDNVSIGLQFATLDPVSHAYRVGMVMNTGNLIMAQSRKPIWYGAFSLCLGCDFERMVKLGDKDAYCWEYAPAFSKAFKNRSVATKGTTNCGTCTDKG